MGSGMRYLSTDQVGNFAFHLVKNDVYLPLKDGNINAQKIEDALFMGIYRNQLPAMTQDDVNFIIQIVEEILEENAR